MQPYLHKAAAALVHLYTGSGGIVGIFAIRAIDASDFRHAFLLIFIATVIDYTDGPLARRLDVRRVLPIVDGDSLDTAIDFVVNVVVPIYLLLRADRLPRPHWMWCALALLPSLFRFANTNPYRGAGFMLGAPPIFVVPAFYVFCKPRIGPLLILAYAILCFVPLGYIHPNRFKRWKLFSTIVVTLWWGAYLAVTQGWTGWSSVTMAVSVATLVMYVAVSVAAFVAYRRGSTAASVRTH